MQNLKGKTALITGASAGIGLECAVKILRAGARTVLVARNKAKGEAAMQEIARRAGGGDVSLMLCDFSEQKQVRALAAEFLARHDALHVLVNNAGAVNEKRSVTPDGIETTFAVNHLGYFLLTNLLLDRIKASAPARIVNVSSIGHRRAAMNFDDLQFEKGGYSILAAYGRSKLANVLFTSELAKRLAGTNVTVNALHPGAVATDIWSGAPWYLRPILNLAKRLLMITPEQGGDTIVHLAMAPEVEGLTGGYYEKNVLTKPSAIARDEAVAKRLWDVSEKLTKLA